VVQRVIQNNNCGGIMMSVQQWRMDAMKQVVNILTKNPNEQVNMVEFVKEIDLVLSDYQELVENVAALLPDLQMLDKLQDDNERLRKDNEKIHARFNKLMKKCKHQKRVMSKQSQRLRKLDPKDLYYNSQKGVRRK
jgi:cell shape-determining protein MreC